MAKRARIRTAEEKGFCLLCGNYHDPAFNCLSGLTDQFKQALEKGLCLRCGDYHDPDFNCMSLYTKPKN